MKEYRVYIEIKGEKVRVGSIRGNNSMDACFKYDEDYTRNPDSVPISIGLPLEQMQFSPDKTRIFFEGLLPEGFLKMKLASGMRTDESDYLKILGELGRECLGALSIEDENEVVEEPRYERLAMDDLRELAREGATRSVELITKSHLSLAGASGKVGLYYDSDDLSWYLPMGTAPSTHIVKQSHIRLDAIVANEQLCLLTAKKLGIDVPESHIINTGYGREEEILFATKRYDRVIAGGKCISGLPAPNRLHQEDMAQAMGIGSERKYEPDGEVYLARMFELLRAYSANPIEDQLKLWDIVVFDYLVGNTDNHIKNLSLIYTEDMRAVRLAPAYDILSTIIYPSSTRKMAFNIGGEYEIDKIRPENFEKAASECRLGVKMAMKKFVYLKDRFEKCLVEASDELMAQGFAQMPSLRYKILKR